jgi:hypothetical protein
MAAGVDVRHKPPHVCRQSGARRTYVDNSHAVAVRRQRVDQVRSDMSGSAGNQSEHLTCRLASIVRSGDRYEPTHRRLDM